MVTPSGLVLAEQLIKIHFGPIVAKVCDCLLRHGSYTFRDVIRLTGIDPRVVKKCLIVLIQHNCVQAYSLPRTVLTEGVSKPVTIYMVIFENIIHRLRFPKFLKIVEDRFGSQCEVLLEGIFQHGRLTFEQLSQHALSKGKTIDPDALKESFNQLVRGHYIERCPNPEPFLSSSAEDVPPPRKRNQKFVLDTMTMEKKALANATLSDAERFSEIMNFGCDGTFEDKSTEHKRKHGALVIDKQTEARIVEKEVLWRANFEKFIHFLRVKACISYKSSRLTHDAGVILEAMIECCSNQSTEVEASLDEIFGLIIAKSQDHMTKEYVGQILDEIGCQQSMKGSVAFYTVDLKSIIKDCRKDEMETIVLQRYGKSACKIFRLLLTKNQPFETDKISDMTFVDKKEAIALFYKLWSDKILHMEPTGSTEQKKAYYLWKVSESASSDFFLENIYHTAVNLNQRIDYHYEENKEFALLSTEDKKKIIKSQSERCKAHQHYVKAVKTRTISGTYSHQKKKKRILEKEEK